MSIIILNTSGRFYFSIAIFISSEIIFVRPQKIKIEHYFYKFHLILEWFLWGCFYPYVFEINSSLGSKVCKEGSFTIIRRLDRVSKE